jgi:hypothetical protein
MQWEQVIATTASRSVLQFVYLFCREAPHPAEDAVGGRRGTAVPALSAGVPLPRRAAALPQGTWARSRRQNTRPVYLVPGYCLD